MIVTSAYESGEDRVYFTRFNSVLSYVKSNRHDNALSLVLEPGMGADPYIFDRVKDDLHAHVMAELARRLGVSIEEALTQRLSDVKRIADPDLPDHYRYARRSKNRAYPTH
jgi:hypothetical protein